MNRVKPNDIDIDSWIQKRNTQCNLDTILQVISLRSQPEVTKIPHRFDMTLTDISKFGFLYGLDENLPNYCYMFEFEVQHPSVFENGVKPLGALYKDCEGVPMIVCREQIKTVPFLNISEELQNIYFEEI